MFSAQIVYSEDYLKPVISSETIRFHYGKHHKGYANTLNDIIQGTEFQNLPLEQIIIQSRDKHPKIFNNASQLFNHDFYWKCLKVSGEQPSEALAQAIQAQFGSFDAFCEAYINFAGTMFGSGWSWLVADNYHLKFINTTNAENPIGSGKAPLCVIDLWEHAYYIDYRNDRTTYIKNLVKQGINWAFCESQFIQK